MLDTHTPMDTMERDLLMLSQRLMLIPISCTEDMALAMLDIMDMLDTQYTYGYYGKRSADAEPKADADPYLLYGGYGLGYAGHYGYAGYPYTYGYYGKRSADAEPKADADPYLLYGAYGYGL